MSRPEFNLSAGEKFDDGTIMIFFTQVLSNILNIMTKSQKGGDLLEFNIFWPYVGVIHLKLKSDGLNHLLASAGTIGLMKLCDNCAERFEQSHAYDGGDNSDEP